MKSLIALPLLAALAFSAQASTADKPAGHPMTGPAGAMNAEMTQQGKVMSVVETQGFTYIEVQRGKDMLWLAAPTTAVKAGDTVHFAEQSMMPRYHSSSLNRDFNNIMFVNRVKVVQAGK
jgi:hypothetical protein